MNVMLKIVRTKFERSQKLEPCPWSSQCINKNGICTMLKKSEGHFLLQAYFAYKLALLFQTKFYNITFE